MPDLWRAQELIDAFSRNVPPVEGYGPLGSAQYDGLKRAIGLDRDAALRGASWGIG
jgi:hypothetical protein